MSHLDSRYILVVEDSDVDFDILESTILKNSIGISLKRQPTGESALKFLDDLRATSAPWPSLIIMDLNLIGMSGVDVTKSIRSSGSLKVIPIVILSTSSSQVDIAEAYLSGANSFLSKPMQFEKFERMITNFFQYWFESAVLPANGECHGRIANLR